MSGYATALINQPLFKNDSFKIISQTDIFEILAYTYILKSVFISFYTINSRSVVQREQVSRHKTHCKCKHGKSKICVEVL